VTDDADSPPARPRPTEAEVASLLGKIFARVEDLQDARASNTLFPPIEPRSDLAGDDRHTRPLQLSHSIQNLISAAVDHQHALARLVGGDRGILHTNAPFSLSRGAIESAATALWMLQPTDSWRQRVRRLVIYQRQDRHDYEVAARLVESRVGGGLPETLEMRKGWIEAIIRACNITNLPRQLDITKVITEVDAAIDTTRHVETFWRTASAFAHGRQWAMINALVREEQADLGKGVAVVKISSDLGRVFWGASIAYELTSRTLNAYREAANAPRPR
jgi:hypothetical protein